MKRRLLMVVVVAALIATGCGGGSGSGSVGQGADLPLVELDGTDAMLIAAVDRTSTATSYRFAMLMSFSAPEFGMEEMRFEVDGAIDSRTNEATMTMDMSSLLEGMSDQELDLFGDLFGDGKIDIVVAGDTAYMRFPALTQMMGSSADWVAVPSEGSSDAISSMGLAFEEPGTLLDGLRSVADVEQVGTDTVGGVDTTMFAVTLDAAELDPSGFMTGDVPIFVWIDDHGQVRRFEMQFDSMGMSGGVVMELSDFGVDVDVKVPNEFMSLDPSMFG
ncbi:MAG: LppX_LprAFG lipoprotein [Acidimicrobiales bacterium]|nr:LppX_LprAFG lipoprotein [Acidimicrobiales bacterium]